MDNYWWFSDDPNKHGKIIGGHHLIPPPINTWGNDYPYQLIIRITFDELMKLIQKDEKDEHTT